MYETKEADWKKYKKLVEGVEEKYLEKQIALLVSHLQDESQSAVSRFNSLRKQIEKSCRELNESLGTHKRSSLFFNLLGMMRNQMINEEDLEPFSEELKDTLRTVIDNFG